MILFDGYAFAAKKEHELTWRVAELRARHVFPKIATIVFEEDTGSVLYTRLKKEAAERVGISYQPTSFSLLVPIREVLTAISQANLDPSVTGVMIQKPSKKKWLEIFPEKTPEEFQAWWHTLASAIHPLKDVDGLHPETLVAIERGTWQQERKVMPATAKAVLAILAATDPQPPQGARYAVIGKSDILGKPLFYELRNRGIKVELLGQKELAQLKEKGARLSDFQVIISATGHAKLITADLLSEKTFLIDVGEPLPDVDSASIQANPVKVSFLTPVPGGVGPVTIVSLLENAVQLAGF
jgi:methylenetetrahydrofolate dehydrogenase (NADP+)/methenyltetrahydrofolate cyclohydrolase